MCVTLLRDILSPFKTNFEPTLTVSIVVGPRLINQTIKLQLFFIFVYTICIEHSFECVWLFRTDHYRRYGSILHKLLNYYTYVCAELTNRPTEVPKLKLNSKNEPKVKHFIYIIFINSPKPTCTFHTVTNGLKASERFIHLWCCVHVFWLV